MTIGRLVPATEHNHEGSGFKVRDECLAQVSLVELEIPRDFQVTQVTGPPQQIGERLEFGIGGQAVERSANSPGPTGGSYPAAVASHPFIRRKAEQHRLGHLVSAEPAAQK